MIQKLTALAYLWEKIYLEESSAYETKTLSLGNQMPKTIEDENDAT